MSRPLALPVTLAALAAVVIVLLGETLVRLSPWYGELTHPEWAPPAPMFGVVWVAVFALAALAAVTAWRGAPTARDADVGLALHAAAGTLTIVWSQLFFRAERPDFAFPALALLLFALAAAIVYCGRYSRSAALLLLPYFVWSAVAMRLNADIVRLNGPF
jgi:tryptophan-rich sensory protein